MKASKTIIDRIKEENIKQKPKWYFKGLQFITWLCYALCILIGAVSFSVILFAIQQTEFNVLSHLSHSHLELLLGLLPFFWILILVVFMTLSIVIFKKSTRGYKYHWVRLYGINTLASIALGAIFFLLGGGHAIEHAFAQKVSSYESIHDLKIRTWMQPDMGFLAGTITQIQSESFQLEDLYGNSWEIYYADALIVHKDQFQVGSRIKIIGKRTTTDQFQAKEIRPWIGQRAYRDMNLP